MDFGAITSDLIETLRGAKLVPSAPCVHISPLLTADDLAVVNDAVDTELARTRRRIIRTTLIRLIDPALFIRVSQPISKEEASPHGRERYRDSGGVIRRCVGSRERSSTSFGGEFAIPHSMRMDAMTTAISVLVSEKGIPWGTSDADWCCFSRLPDGRQIFCDSLDQIIRLLTETGSVRA
ncbi:MAG: hypothetical protein R2722_06295 [Tessaracoccus sp.]